MSPQVLRILFGILLLGHGLGHALTAFPQPGFRSGDIHPTGSRLLGSVSFLFPDKIGVIGVNAWAIASVLRLRWSGGSFDG